MTTTNKAYPGSCHCGAVQYQVRLKLPPIMERNAESVRIYKCNCTLCHKMGMFHVRPIDRTNDFILTSPSTIEELGDYRYASKTQGWYFCKKCGVRVVGVAGEWEQVEVDVEVWAGRKDEEEEGKKQKVWRTQPTTRTRNGKTEPYHYISVNAVTLEPGEEVDLRKWHDEGWVFYVENLKDEHAGEFDLKRPFEGGMY